MSNCRQYFKTDIWEPVPLVSKEMRARGLKGGEGCQVVLYITRDYDDGQFAMVGTDVGGMYKSNDGGHTWTPATTGMECAAATGMEIDPKNKNHAIAVGCNSYGAFRNGLYLSWDGADTWHGVKYCNVVSYRDHRQQVAFDPSSYDAELGGSAVVYWSREKTPARGHNHPALYKSTDGGETWAEIPDSARFGDSLLAVHPTKGWLYIANEDGLFRSKDGAQTFEQLLDTEVTWIDVLQTRPDNVYVTTRPSLMISTDSGDSFQAVESDSYPTAYPRFLRVSPANQQDMVLQDDHQEIYSSQMYYTHDGGKTWHKADNDYSDSFMPFNSHLRPSAWSPDGTNLITLGGDFMMRSDDKGETWVVSNEGYNGICVGGAIGYNVNNPDLMLAASQDYNGGFSTDGGYTWTYVNWSGLRWGGFTYAGYIWDENEMCCGLAESWNGGRMNGGNTLEICVTRDGGKTIEHTGVYPQGMRGCMGIIGDNDVCFFGEYRTDDRGKTWTCMADEKGERVVDGVLAYDYSSQRIFGVRNGDILQSWDKGLTWEQINHLEVTPGSISYDHKNDLLYFISAGKLYVMDGTGLINRIPECYLDDLNSVAVSPEHPEILYVAGCTSCYYGQECVARSMDGGKTWTNLTRMADGNMKDSPDGGHQAGDLYLNPKSNEIFIVSGCRGIWKMKVPTVE